MSPVRCAVKKEAEKFNKIGSFYTDKLRTYDYFHTHSSPMLARASLCERHVYFRILNVIRVNVPSVNTFHDKHRDCKDCLLLFLVNTLYYFLRSV